MTEPRWRGQRVGDQVLPVPRGEPPARGLRDASVTLTTYDAVATRRAPCPVSGRSASQWRATRDAAGAGGSGELTAAVAASHSSPAVPAQRCCQPT